VSSTSSGGEHDSTGLRAERKLNTPLSRCASLRKHAAFCAASETIQQIAKEGGAKRFPLLRLMAQQEYEAIVGARCCRAAHGDASPCVRDGYWDDVWDGVCCLRAVAELASLRSRMALRQPEMRA
jgi:hypothetical protein